MISKLVFLDYMILLAVLAFAVVGAQRGFSKTAAGTVAILGALIGAIICAGTLTPELTACLERTVSDSLENQLAAYLPVGSGVAGSELAGVIMGVLQDTVIKTILFTLVFLLILLVWLYACCYFDAAAKFPTMKRFNQLAGALCGIVKGAVMCLIVLYILSQLGILSSEFLNTSFLLQKLNSLLPGIL